jgi:hypothetical protein
LGAGEAAYAVFPAKRQALVERIQEFTTGRSKKSGGISRAIVGGVLLGPVGAVVGGATAGSKINTRTHQIRSEVLTPIDKGEVLLTNRRMLFVGNEIVSMPYGNLLSISLHRINRLMLKGYRLDVKYEAMKKGECYLLEEETGGDFQRSYESVTKTPLTYNPENAEPSPLKNLLVITGLYFLWALRDYYTPETAGIERTLCFFAFFGVLWLWAVLGKKL